MIKDNALFLNKILEVKKEQIKTIYSQHKAELLDDATEKKSQPSFIEALKKPRVSLIAEIKRASPSKGIIRSDFDPLKLAKEFELYGARALSILTETDFFLGHPRYVSEVAKTTSLPILRKDFIIDPIQVYETYALGASAMLLIVAILSKSQLKELFDVAQKLKLEVLVEVHNQEELDLIRDLNLPIIGVNNRNLKTFDTDPKLAIHLIHEEKLRAANTVFVAESGYSSADQIKELESYNIDAVLIGEGLAKDPGLLEYFSE